MTIYTDVFGGALIYPAELSYRAVALTVDTETVFPTEGPQTPDVLARIMDVTPSAAGFSLLLPNAQLGSNGYTSLFNNRGADSFFVRDFDGNLVATVAAGEAWQVYLSDNTTDAGTWQAFQFASFISMANAAALAGPGLTTYGSLLATNIPITSFNISTSVSAASRAGLYVWTGNAGNLTLPDPATVLSGWYIDAKNLGAGSLTVDTDGSSLIDGAATKVFSPGDAATIATDGSNYFTVGFGQNAVFAFDTVSIDVSGTGDYTLTGSELNRISYTFSGLLTGNRNIIVPATIQQYWVRNITTGAFTLTVKVSGQPGTTVTQGGAAILYSDGTDVVEADTAGISTPISIGDGGTGATTASAARVNLGAGAVGDAVFVAATGAAAYAALGPLPAGAVDGGVFP